MSDASFLHIPEGMCFYVVNPSKQEVTNEKDFTEYSFKHLFLTVGPINNIFSLQHCPYDLWYSINKLLICYFVELHCFDNCSGGDKQWQK